jgi:AcrR family transcriptional regulator
LAPELAGASEPVVAGPPVRVDGRSRRAERTREAIVDAHLALLDEGHLRTPAARIAERAGVSLRALWTNFKDLETLYAAAGQRLWERQREHYVPVPADLPLRARVEEYCRQRGRMQEIIAPAARAAHLWQAYSPQLRRNRHKQIAGVRDEIEQLFASELDAAGPGRTRLVNAILVVSTFNWWQMAREELELDVDEAGALMIQTVTGLLVTALAATA